MTQEEKQEKIIRISLLRNAIVELNGLKRAVKSADNSKRLKKSNLNNWAKECLDNSITTQLRLEKLDRAISAAKIKIETLKLEISLNVKL